MKWLAVFFAFLALAFASDVLILTDENFDEQIKDSNVLVEFFAPWCGHCKKLAPEYEKAATTLKGENIKIASVDATVETAVAERFGIRGYPTLKFFRNGVPKEYNGGRTADAIVTYCKKQLTPALSPLDSQESIDNFAKANSVVVIGFFASETDEAFVSFKSIVSVLRDDFTFGSVIGNPELAAALGASVPGYVLLKQFDDRKSIHTAGKDLTAWIKEESTPLLDEIGPENYQKYMDSGLPLLFLFLDPAVDNSAVKETFTGYAKAQKGKVNFCWIDNSKYASQAQRLGLVGTSVPCVGIDDPKAGFHYAYDESVPFDAAAAGEWIAKFTKGEVEPTIKSEPIPENNNGPVKILVQKNFDAIVKDTTKDVLVEFYAPWCGHCKKLAPIYEKLGETFAKIDSVVIAKIDATANDVDPKLGIRGFPTLKLFTATGKDAPINFEGDRSLEGMASFIKANAAVKFDLDTEGLKEDL
jgi:protein disulfide-isomerase A1